MKINSFIKDAILIIGFWLIGHFLIGPMLHGQTVQPTYRFVVVDAQGRNVAKFTVAQLREWLIGSGLGTGGSGGGNFVDGEIPTGLINGSNRTFTLAQTPNGGILLCRNGIVQRLNTDYTVSGKVITFSNVSVPELGDLIIVFYRYL